VSIRTTVVGSWPIPFGQRAKLKQYYAGELTDEEADSTLAAAARIAMDEQIACGLDEIMGGEVFAPDFLHHVPPRLAGLKTIRARDTSKGYDGVGIYEVTGKISAPLGTGHAKAFRRESAMEPGLQKASVPSPLTIGGGFRSKDRPRHLNDMIEIVRDEIADMIAAGAKEIQLDAPAEAVGLVMGSSSVDELLPLVTEPLGAAEKVRRSIHFCLGDISRTTATEDQNLRNLLPLIQKLDGVVHRVHIECSYPGQWQERPILDQLPGSMQIIAGIADVKSSPDSEQSLRDKILQLLEIIPTDRLLVSSSCGCGRVPHDEAIRLMRNLVKASAAIEG
jgi:methionine synthase II (cobalamin-independent)|tara:strand:- start:1903 stop:2907 length:1005 start_codon:yes stop_codon:yes gene_type:complete